MSSKNTSSVFRPINCKFLDECCKSSLWLSYEGAKEDFPDCEIKGYSDNEALDYLHKHNLKMEDVKLYK